MTNDLKVSIAILYDILLEAMKEIAEEELDEGDSPTDLPTFGAQYYVEIARKALKDIGEKYE